MLSIYLYIYLSVNIYVYIYMRNIVYYDIEATTKIVRKQLLSYWQYILTTGELELGDKQQVLLLNKQL